MYCKIKTLVQAKKVLYGYSKTQLKMVDTDTDPSKTDGKSIQYWQKQSALYLWEQLKNNE